MIVEDINGMVDRDEVRQKLDQGLASLSMRAQPVQALRETWGSSPDQIAAAKAFEKLGR